MKRSIIYLAVIAAVAVSAAATEAASSDLVIPIVGRGPGAFGSQWRTDLVVTNADRRFAAPVEIRYYGNDGTQQSLEGELVPRESLVLRDVLQTTFGHDTAAGWMSVTSTNPDAKLTARARVYNAGSAAGEYGQIVPATPRARLATEAYLTGLSGLDGNRTNVGIANPTEREAGIFVSLFQEDGEFRGGFSTVVQPRKVLQLNDIFYHLGTEPLSGATVQITSVEGVIPWASIVRNDTGDGDFITGTAVGLASDVVQPLCASPAALHLSTRPADGWIVIYKPGTNAVEVTNGLSSLHGFTVRTVYEHGFQGFASYDLNHATIAKLRCEPAVQLVEQNTQVIP